MSSRTPFPLPLTAFVLLFPVAVALSAQGAPPSAPPIPPPDAAGRTGIVAALPSGSASIDPSSLLGLTLVESYGMLGVPDSVFPYRGVEAWQDDVVFYYGVRLYLFWYGDRVWQVRFDSRYRGTFFGCAMGMKKSDVLSALGGSVRDDGEWVLFALPDRGFPVRAHLRFTDGVLSDAYVYRGDF